MSEKKNYYEVLGVNKNATLEEIEKARKKMAFKWHPDRNADNRKAAEEKMKEINEAYSVLSDKKKRKMYDMTGNAYSSAGEENYSTGDFGFDIHQRVMEILKQQQQRDKKSGFDFSFDSSSSSEEEFSEYSLEENLSFKELIFGTKKKLFLKMRRVCGSCQGTGALSQNDIVTCSQCKGKGIISESFFGFSQTFVCDQCSGKGKIFRRRCPDCLGRKFVFQNEEVVLNIPRGILVGHVYRYRGLGHSLSNRKKGDILVKFKMKENPYFHLKGESDIRVDVPVSFVQAALGATVKVITLDGIEELVLPSGTQTGDFILLKNRGCYFEIESAKRGNLYVYWQVTFPKKLNDISEKLLEKVKENLNWNPNEEFIVKNRNVIDK